MHAPTHMEKEREAERGQVSKTGGGGLSGFLSLCHFCLVGQMKIQNHIIRRLFIHD